MQDKTGLRDRQPEAAAQLQRFTSCVLDNEHIVMVEIPRARLTYVRVRPPRQECVHAVLLRWWGVLIMSRFVSFNCFFVLTRQKLGVWWLTVIDRPARNVCTR